MKLKKIVSSKRRGAAIYLPNLHNKKLKIYVSKKFWNYKPTRQDEGYIQIGRTRIYEGAWRNKGFEWFLRADELSFVEIEFVKSPNKHTYLSIKPLQSEKWL